MVSVLPPRSLPFREIRHTPLLFRLKILRILTPILRTSSGFLHFFLQPLLGDLVGKLVDTLHDSVKQVVDVHGRALLVVVYALTYRRDGESVGRRLNFFRAGLLGAYLPGGGGMCRYSRKTLGHSLPLIRPSWHTTYGVD